MNTADTWHYPAPHYWRTLMPTIFHTLDQSPEDHEILLGMYAGIFLEGECYAFALALHQGLGWPMVGLMKGDLIWHAGVRAPDGRIRDVRGFHTDDTFGEYFLSGRYVIRPVTAEELYATRPIHERVIQRARSFAETLWPDLPWIETYAMLVHAFADELEALSRKHGFWITGGVPADPPRLYAESGDEGGYRVRSTIDGNAHTIARYFPFELKLEEAEDALR